ncbi:MAG: 4a-hydroxytetrahydrobiopterin dehydratase [Thermoanaerobaculia bacterium]
MKPERIGLTLLDLHLFEWVVLLMTGVQAVQRTFAFANFEYATEFAAEIGELAEEHQIFPHLTISTPVAEAVPTLVVVTLSHPDLKDEHLKLAKAIEVAYVTEMETAGA